MMLSFNNSNVLFYGSIFLFVFFFFSLSLEKSVLELVWDILKINPGLQLIICDNRAPSGTPLYLLLVFYSMLVV